jgi:HK97 family phage prohead protease
LDQEYSLPLPIGEVKALGEGDPDGPAYLVEGYLATTGGPPDLGNDVILPGAFDATLAAGHKVRFLRQHDHSKVLGTVLGLKADGHGLHGRFKISRTPLGEETYQLLKDGALDSFSIGYLADEAEHKDGGIRELKQLTLLEASVVSLPMNPRALVTAVKGAPAGAAGLPFDALWQQLRDAFVALQAGTAEAKALAGRREQDGRGLTPRHLEHLSKTLEAAEAVLSDLRPLATPGLATSQLDGAPAKAEAPGPDAEAEAARLRLRLSRARRRLLAAGVLTPQPREGQEP